jgi:hypothetical protein
VAALEVHGAGVIGRGDSPGIATGLLLLVVGTWVVARTFIHDAGGQNLVDRLLAIAGGGDAKPSGVGGVVSAAFGVARDPRQLFTGPLSTPVKPRPGARSTPPIVDFDHPSSYTLPGLPSLPILPSIHLP